MLRLFRSPFNVYNCAPLLRFRFPLDQHVLVLLLPDDRVLPTKRRVRSESLAVRCAKVTGAADKRRQTNSCKATSSSGNDGSGQNSCRPANDEDAELIGDRVCLTCPTSASSCSSNANSKYCKRMQQNAYSVCTFVRRVYPFAVKVQRALTSKNQTPCTVYEQVDCVQLNKTRICCTPCSRVPFHQRANSTTCRATLCVWWTLARDKFITQQVACAGLVSKLCRGMDNLLRNLDRCIKCFRPA
jgi:hypothetical protein